MQVGVEGRRFKELFIDEMQQLSSYEVLYALRKMLHGEWDDPVGDIVTECLIRAAKRAVEYKRRYRN